MRSQKKQARIEKRKQALQGHGNFLFKNITRGELILPKATNDGTKIVPRGECFQGDSYFLMMVPSELRVIEDLSNMEKTLITEQPPVVTNQGTVEYVVSSSDQSKVKLNEQEGKTPDVLITENPIDGVEIIRD